MKNLFMLIALLTMLCTYSQTTSTTKEQKQRIDSYSPENYIEWSKGLSNEKRQRIEIDSLQKIIDAKDMFIAKLHKQHKDTLTKIAIQNTISENSSKELDSTTNDIVTDLSNKIKRKFDWGRVNLYGGIEIPEFDYKQTLFTSELMYQIKNIEFGLKGEAEVVIVNEEIDYKAQYFLKLRYKFF